MARSEITWFLDWWSGLWWSIGFALYLSCFWTRSYCFPHIHKVLGTSQALGQNLLEWTKIPCGKRHTNKNIYPPSCLNRWHVFERRKIVRETKEQDWFPVDFHGVGEMVFLADYCMWLGWAFFPFSKTVFWGHAGIGVLYWLI